MSEIKVDPLTNAAAPNRHRAWAGILLAIALVLVLVLVGLLVALRVKTHRASPNADDRASAQTTAAMTTANSSLATLLSYTPQNVSQDLASETELLTGQFKTDYTQLVTTVVAPSAIRGGVTTQAVVVGSGVVTASADTVTLIEFVDVSTTSKNLPESRVSGSRLRVTMQNVDGHWLISNLQPV